MAPFLPFKRGFRGFAGSQWFAGNRRAAHQIVCHHARKTKLKTHYRSLLFAEESYFQCILANAPDLKIHNENYRYIDWSAGGSHPKMLALCDLPALVSSEDDSARKVGHETSDSSRARWDFRSDMKADESQA